MSPHITKHRQGFPWGITTVTQANDEDNHTGIKFSVLKLQKGKSQQLQSPMELACLHMEGEIQVTVENQQYNSVRNSLFDDPPFAVHVPPNKSITIEAISDAELTLFETENDKDFKSVVYLPDDTKNEHRGKGQVDNASLRYVRTIFDGTNSDPNANLVLGEVVNFPGRWSSYPPHHHPQPEIYHYRFTDPIGVVYSGNRVIEGKPFPIKVLNVLGAGDAFMSGFLRGFLRDLSLEECCTLANANGIGKSVVINFRLRMMVGRIT